uniref:Uncharacterized protein n=1 Tax=Rhipicephalus microplus TaxID=6941 RepID=A0A6M2DBW5_RHIMP
MLLFYSLLYLTLFEIFQVLLLSIFAVLIRHCLSFVFNALYVNVPMYCLFQYTFAPPARAPVGPAVFCK